MKSTFFKSTLTIVIALSFCSLSSCERVNAESKAKQELKRMGANLGKGSLDPSLEAQEYPSFDNSAPAYAPPIKTPDLTRL